MARTAREPIEHLPVVGPSEGREIDAHLAAGAAQIDGEAIAERLLLDGASDLLIEVGRIQGIHAIATVADSVIASRFDAIKKSKSYIGFPYRDEDGKVRRVADLEEFCRIFLGKSYRRCQEISAQRHQLGADLYEVAERVGFRTRDYRALAALPEDDQAAVKLALESSDKDRALEVLSDLVARQAAQKAAADDALRVARGERDEAQADYQAATKLIADAQTKIRRLEGGDIRPLTLDAQIQPWPGTAGYLIGEIRRCLTQIGLLIESAERLPIPPDDTPEQDQHQRAMRLIYDALGAPLAQLGEEIEGVSAHLDRIVGAIAYPDRPWMGAGQQGGMGDLG